MALQSQPLHTDTFLEDALASMLSTGQGLMICLPGGPSTSPMPQSYSAFYLCLAVNSDAQLKDSTESFYLMLHSKMFDCAAVALDRFLHDSCQQTDRVDVGLIKTFCTVFCLQYDNVSCFAGVLVITMQLRAARDTGPPAYLLLSICNSIAVL